MSISILTLLLVLFTCYADANDVSPFERSKNAIVHVLPFGWTIVEQRTNEIPWGHHWNENYTGPRGILVVAKGTRPVTAEFSDTKGQWHPVRVATESLEIWLMPGDYSESLFGWLANNRPTPPTTVLNHGPIKVYARPSHVLLSEAEFDKTLSKFRGIRWPDSPVNSPELLSWKNWRVQLKDAIQRAFIH